MITATETSSRNAPCHCGSGQKYKRCCLEEDEAQRKPSTGKYAVLICMPTRCAISHETQTAIERNMPGIPCGGIRVAHKPVAEARNEIARKFLSTVASNPFPFTPRETYALWLDDDAWFPPGLVQTMINCMNEFTSIDALFGWFGPRVPFASPTVYTKFGDDQTFPQPGLTCKPGELVPIAWGGFHLVLMRPRLLQRIGTDPFTPKAGEGEDHAFCRRAEGVGARLVVGTAFPVAHVGPRDGTGYLPGMPAFQIENNSMKTLTLEHVGASGEVKTAEVRKYGLTTV